MVTNNYTLASFRSRQQSIRFEQTLRQAGIQASVVSTPKEVAIGCGVSVRIPTMHAGRALELYRANPQPMDTLVGFYRVEQQGARSRVLPVTKS